MIEQTGRIKRTVRRSVMGAASTTMMIQAGMAVGVAAAMLSPQLAYAQQADPAATPTTTLGVVKVKSEAIDPNPNAEPGVPYKAKTSGDERHTRPLAELPQTIQVLTKAQIDDSGYTDMSQILDAQPGITIGTGENGNAFGDRYIIRGQEARSDTFVDGLRDPGMTIRESFAIEQLEISKGASSSFAGRGTSGGAINAITKKATTDYSFAKAAAGFGTDNHTRLTLDANQVLDDQFAVRANLLYGYENVPGRKPADRRRQGAALSGIFTPTDDLEISLDYYGLKAKDSPDLGGYLIGSGANRKPAPLTPAYVQDPDFLASTVNTGTARVSYRFNPDIRVTNIFRVGHSNNGYVTTGSRSSTTAPSNPGGSYLTTTLDSHNNWQNVKYVANQTNLFWNQDILGFKNEFIVGAEYTNHSVRNGAYNVASSGENCIVISGRAPNIGTSPSWCITDENGNPVNGINTLMNRQISVGNVKNMWKVKTFSASLMDTVDLTEDLTAFGGLRMDWFDYHLTTFTGPTLVRNDYPYSDNLLNGYVGLVYKITPQVNVYASWSTAADINGGESDVGTSSGYGGAVIYDGSIAAAKPERSRNFEVGTKWNVFDDRLLATAALFQNTKSDVMEGADYDSIGTFNTGELRIRGVELEVSGMVTDDLTVAGGFSYMNSEILKSSNPINVGHTLANFANASGTLQVKYRVTDEFSLGGAVKYESKRYGGQPDTAAPYSGDYHSQPVPDYTVFDLFGSYKFNDNLNLRVNVNNLFDRTYFTAAYRAGFFLYKGDGRAVRATLEYAL